MTNAIGKPEISVIVVVHNMAREAPRTLYSLSARYQRDIAASEYEVIVVDNGSTPPLDPDMVAGLDGDFRLIRLDPAPPSPAHAINVGLAAARGDVIGVMIDGARMTTPGLLHFARAGVRLYPRAVVVTLGWYLGRDQQRWASECGYDRRREDALLASIGWPEDGYRLFDIAAFDESSVDGWFDVISEANALFLSRDSWDRLGGLDERFDLPGGGLVNHDTLIRAIDLPDSRLVVLLGEGTFHQLHGGIASNANYRTFPDTIAKWRAQYEVIRGKPWAPPAKPKRTYLGVLPLSALIHIARGAVEPVSWSPLGPRFDRSLWMREPAPRPSDAVAASLLDLAANELRDRRFEAAAAVARIARAHAPDEPGPQYLLQTVGPWLRGEGIPRDDRRVGFHLARAKAYELLGDRSAARSEYEAALRFDFNLPAAHVGLAHLQWPGEDYMSWLTRLHAALRPRIYFEIGVDKGRSLALAQPPTRAIAVDPSPRIETAPKAECHLFCETSDAFFSTPRLAALLAGQPLDLTFIDGLHRFEQALKDFINIEAYCGPRSVVLLHDTIPLNELTQRRTRETLFWTGDVWKAILCLKHYRPDLAIFTIATPPTGLTVVANLDAGSRVLAERFEEAIDRFVNLPYSEIGSHLSEHLNIVPNDWNAIEEQLKAFGSA